MFCEHSIVSMIARYAENLDSKSRPFERVTRRRRSRSLKSVQYLRVCTLEDLLAGGTGGGSDHLIDQIQSQADLFL